MRSDGRTRSGVRERRETGSRRARPLAQRNRESVQHWFMYPNIDPVAFRIGPLAVHWYGLSYLAGFIAVGLWMAWPKHRRRLGLSIEQVQDFLVYSLVGVLVGGRVFFVIADIVSKHDAAYYFGDLPRSLWNLIAVWNGGMGFFGGLVGVIVAMAIFVRRQQRRVERAGHSGPVLTFSILADEVVMMLPLGLALTRIVNFINDELVGNICSPDRPWCIKFPSADGFRYPSQIFEAILDILVLPILLVLAGRRPPDGVVAWSWFTLYGVTRTVAEIWRQTDLAVGPFTGGQLFSLAMIVIGIVMIVRCVRAGRRTDEIPEIAPAAATS
jgi:phosphatidylglycerol:prolipoprotein diacylglycerol transferase